MDRNQNAKLEAAKAGVIGSLDSVLLKSAPIEPSWILSGEARARSGLHSASRDGGAITNIWDCTAGSFRWYFGWEETVLILDGSVKVTSPDGHATVLKVGDVAYFAAGTTWVWEIETYVRKLAFLRRPASKPDRIIRSLRDKLQAHATAARVGIGLAAAAAASLVAISAIE